VVAMKIQIVTVACLVLFVDLIISVLLLNAVQILIVLQMSIAMLILVLVVAMKTQIVIAACLVLFVNLTTSVQLQSVVSTLIVVLTISHVQNVRLTIPVPILNAVLMMIVQMVVTFFVTTRCVFLVVRLILIAKIMMAFVGMKTVTLKKNLPAFTVMEIPMAC
jgi:hypothetical protein